MTKLAFALFDTAIGRCGIVWGAAGTRCIALPEAGEAKIRARIAARFPEATEQVPKGKVARAIADIGALLRGESLSLGDIELDMQGVPPFHQRVYTLARSIAPGSTLSYGEVAQKLASPGAARAVGQALSKNPFAIVVPCHRVLAAGGKTGGFTADGGVETKLRMLAIERAAAQPRAPSFEGDGAFGFDVAHALEHLHACDDTLSALMHRVGPFALPLKNTPSIFVALAESIVHQQLTGKAAATIWGRLCGLYPKSAQGPTPALVLKTAPEKLRAAGLSGAKVLAMKDLAQKTLDGTVPTLGEVHALDDEAIIEQLTAVRGIGRWTVEMLLMFRLGRPDVLPVDDFGVRKGFSIAYGLAEGPSKKELAAHGARWAPYRSVASWYMWRAVDLASSERIGAPKPTKVRKPS